jgi:20S proteasome alpha/beta subunit
MTLVIAAPGPGFLVLGADSRGTLEDAGGSRIELNIFEKLVVLDEHVSVLMYGDGEAARYLVEEFKRSIGKTPIEVSKVGKRFADFCRKELRAVPPVSRNSMPGFGYVIAGLDKKDKVYSVPRCLGMVSQDGFWLRSYQKFAIEGKPLIANYLFAKQFKDNMSVNDLTQLVAQALYDTINIDGDVGGRITLAIIASEGTRVLPPEDLESLIDPWGRPIL